MRASPYPLPSHSLRLMACLLLAAPAAVQAQAHPPTANAARHVAPADASVADATTVPLVYHPGWTPQPPLTDASPSSTSWRDAHTAVGAFPRGHADIVAWEARNPAQVHDAAAAPLTAPAAAHRGHGGHGAAGPQAQPGDPRSHPPGAQGDKPPMPMKHHGHKDHHPSGGKP